MSGTFADGSWSPSSAKKTKPATKRKSLSTSQKRQTQSSAATEQQAADTDMDPIKSQSKSSKRRKARDGSFRAVGDQSSSDELFAEMSEDELAPKKRKQRKAVDRTFRSKTSEDDSDDHMVVDKAKAKPKSLPAYQPAASNKQLPKPSPSSQLISQPVQARQASVKIEDAEPQAAASQAAPPAESASAPQAKSAQPSKKRRRVDDTPFVHKSIETSDDDDIASPSHARTSGPATDSLRKSQAVKLESSPGKHDGAVAPAPTRKASIYTEAQARRDAQEAQDAADEPSPKKLKRELAHGQTRREERIKKQLDLHRKKGPSGSNWTKGELKLFDKLVSRGHQPQLPASWMRDFPTLSEDRFFAKDGEETCIKALVVDDEHPTHDFRANKAFRELTYLGATIRDQLIQHKRPEKAIAKSIRLYKSWAYNDAELEKASFHERVVIVRDDSQGAPDPRKAALRMEHKLNKLALEHRKAYIEDNNLEATRKKVEPVAAPVAEPLAEPVAAPVTKPGFWFKFGSASDSDTRPQRPRTPSWLTRLFGWTKSANADLRPATSDSEVSTDASVESELTDANATATYELVEPKLPEDMGMLYGILISHSIVQIVTYDVANAEDKLRNMIVCNFGTESQDIWNSMAVAITICHARDEILEEAQPDIVERRQSDWYDTDA